MNATYEVDMKTLQLNNYSGRRVISRWNHYSRMQSSLRLDNTAL